MGAIEANDLGFRFPGGRQLFSDVSFRVGDGDCAALVGANGAGKTTLLRLLAGEEPVDEGSLRVDGRIGFMHQLLGAGEATTVRDLLLSLSPLPLRQAAGRIVTAQGSGDGMRIAEALAAWGDAGGYEAEVLWDTCTTIALRQGFDTAGERPLAELSGGEQKRLALELLLRSDADVLILDEPDNFLDVPAKEWLAEALRGTTKTVLFVSHDRQLLADTTDKVITLEGRGAWTHGGSFATWHEARQARLDRLDAEHRRWREERDRLQDQVRELRRRLQMTDAFSTRLRATQTKVRRHEASAPPERPADQRVAIRLEGDRTGKRVVSVQGLSFPGVVAPFDTEVLFGERVGVLGPNGTGKTHFMRLLAGHEVPHTGEARLGARVVPGHFSQTHVRPDLAGRRLRDVLAERAMATGQIMATLKRYELQEAVDQPFDTLSGGQQARFQILLLELTGATLLLLDEPTDNLDLASAEALEEALGAFVGTVLAVTHDRWFARGFDRFLLFRRDGSVVEALEPAWA